MKKTISIKSLSTLALLCLLSYHSELKTQPKGLNDTVIVITSGDIITRLNYISAGAMELNGEVLTINERKHNAADIERVNKIQFFLETRFESINNICSEFNYNAEPFLNETKKLIEHSSKNVETLTNNFYIRNTNNALIQNLLNAVLEQYPMLEFILNMILKFK